MLYFPPSRQASVHIHIKERLVRGAKLALLSHPVSLALCPAARLALTRKSDNESGEEEEEEEMENKREGGR